MNLTNLTILVRRIKGLLRQHEQEAQGPQLAQDFAVACQSVVQRLAQCEAMLNQGSEYQALQQAEASPALLDLLTRVGFREFAQWHAYCQARQYPVPPFIDAGIIRRLNLAYAKGISTDHPLYADYRGAILTGDDDGALTALRLIVQLNPSDTQMQMELEQCEARVLKVKLDELEEALTTDDPGNILRHLEDIEIMNPTKRPTGDVWMQGQYARVKLKLETLPALREVQDWGATLSAVDEIKALCDEQGIMLPEEDTTVLQEAETWADGERRAYEEEQLYRKTLGELEYLIDQCEQKRVSIQESSMKTLCVEAEALQRKWREVERFNRPVSQEFEDRLDKALQLLEIEIRVKGRHRRNIFTALAVVVVVLALVGGIWLVRQRSISDTAKGIRMAMTNRQVLAVSNLLAAAAQQKASLTNSAALGQAIRDGNSWMAQELGAATHCEQSLTDLARRIAAVPKDTSLPPEEWRSLQGKMEEAVRGVESTAPDLQRTLKTRLDRISDDWERLLAETKHSRSEAFNKKLGSAREAARPLDYKKGAGGVSGVLDVLGPLLDELRAITNAPLPQLGIEPDSLMQLEGLSARHAAFSTEVSKWNQTTNNLATAQSPAAYLEALRAFVKSEFSPAEQRPLAEKIIAEDVSTDRFLQTLLLPTSREGWTTFQNSRRLVLWPEGKANAEEKKLISGLGTDPYIHSIFLVDFLETGSSPLRRIYGWNATKDGFDVDADPGGTKVRMSLYDPQDSPQSLVFRARTVGAARFQWQYKSSILSERSDAPLDRKFPATAERFIYASSGLTKLCDDTDAYGASLLETADQLRSVTNSPVFTAYLLLRIGEIADIRPLSWGLQWSPAFDQHRRRLREIAQGDLASGDWMVPGKIQKLGPGLDRFFQETQSISYMRQARFFHRLAEATVDGGMAFAGYVDADGKGLHLLSPEVKQDLWGMEREKQTLVRLFRWPAGARSLQTEGKPAPFSPLYARKFAPRSVVRVAEQAAYVKADEPTIKPWLNPLFTEE